MINVITPLNKGTYKQPNIFGYYGNFGGAYIPEMLHRNVEELKKKYFEIMYEMLFKKSFAIVARLCGQTNAVVFCRTFEP